MLEGLSGAVEDEDTGRVPNLWHAPAERTGHLVNQSKTGTCTSRRSEHCCCVVSRQIELTRTRRS